MFDPFPFGLLTLIVSLEAIFLATFENDRAGAAPSPNQQTGTVAVAEGAGTVRVVMAPPGASSNWVQNAHRRAAIGTLMRKFRGGRKEPA